jgi:trimethylamine--corrinoid protein Co-methyltransferase
MHAAGHAFDLMSPAEIDLVHCSALRILDEMGFEVQNQSILAALSDIGARVDLDDERAYFPVRLVERFIAEAEKVDWATLTPRVSGSAGVYHSLYHDPVSGRLVPWTEEALAFYFALARHLPQIDGAHMLGCRLAVPQVLGPLYERYYCWKYGARESGTIHLNALCPYILEVYQIWADTQGVPLLQVFRGEVYLIPPLKLGRYEADQIAYFRERGLRVQVGDMYAMGASAPATLAGAVTLNLAEQLALRILEWALYGDRRLHLNASISVMDMRTTVYPYGRPEMALANLMTAQLARHYGASFSGHAGLSDAKAPSVEAGAQKALTSIPTLLAGGSVWIDAGLLSIDEICSPVQMVLDNEFMAALGRFAHESEINEDAIGLETIVEAGPGGHFLDKLHTVRHFRDEHWRPEIWSRTRLRPWIEQGSRPDSDRARDVALDVQSQVRQSETMSVTVEREILRVIDAAGRELGCA